MTLSTFNRYDFISIAAGDRPGYSAINKYGYTGGSSVFPSTIWPGTAYTGAEYYTFSDTADIDSLSSTSVLDTAANGVIWAVYGIKADGTEDVQIVLPDGQNKTLLNTKIKAVNRVINVGSTSNSGYLYIYVDGSITGGVPDVKNTIRAIVITGQNQTEQCVYTVPDNRSALVYGGYADLITSLPNKTAQLSWRGSIPGGPALNKGRITLSSSNKLDHGETYPWGIRAQPGTRLWIQVDNADSATTAINGRFFVLLKPTI